jgi:hypothetical protein
LRIERHIHDEDDIIPLLEDILPNSGGWVAMLKAYLDLGKKADAADEVMCMASVIFKPTRYKQFVRPWKRMLKSWDASAFHATDFYPGALEFKRNTPERLALFEEDSRRIPRMIGDYVSRVLLVSFCPQEYFDAAPPGWTERFGRSLHSIAVQLCLISNGWWRYERCRHERFAYFMESGDTDEGEVLKTVERMRHQTETAGVIRVSAFTPVDKGLAKGLEAADFAAWHWNKYYMDKVRARKPMEPRKDFSAFANIVDEKLDFMFTTGDLLKYLFSRVPKSVLEGKAT